MSTKENTIVPRKGYVIHEDVLIGSLKSGDTVLIDGVQKTVTREYLKYCPFTGQSLFGAAYPKRVTKVTRYVPISNGGYRRA